jgi:4'-phosphopantetheinyl transferase
MEDTSCFVAMHRFAGPGHRSVRRSALPRSPHWPQSRFALPSSADEAVEVVVTRLDTRCETIRASEGLLSADELERARRFAFVRDRHRFVARRSELRRLLATRLGMHPRAIEFAYGRHGKPALAERHAAPDVRFNVSRCGDLVAFAFADGRDVGVDIEALRFCPDADGIAARFFSEGEGEAYRSLPPSQKPLGFFNCWTRKEAFVKALGTGLGYPLDRFAVSLAPGAPARLIRIGDTPGHDAEWTLYAFRSEPALVGAVVVRKSREEYGRDRQSTSSRAFRDT